MGLLIAIFLFGLAMTGLVALGLVFALSFEAPETRDQLRGFGESEAARATDEQAEGSQGSQ